MDFNYKCGKHIVLTSKQKPGRIQFLAHCQKMEDSVPFTDHIRNLSHTLWKMSLKSQTEPTLQEKQSYNRNFLLNELCYDIVSLNN